jgi:hypothetical protein
MTQDETQYPQFDPTDRAYLSFSDIDDLQTEQILLVIKAWKANRISPYRSRTKGSMYPRKDLPEKLKPFVQSENDPRKGFNAITFKPF